jgi:hypothetical protein
VASAPISFGLRVLIGQVLDYWIDHGGLSSWDAYRTDPTFQGRKVTLVFERPSESFLSTRDTVLTSFCLAKISASEPDPAWDTSDYTNVETLLDTWWRAIRGDWNTDIDLVEVRWYQEGPGVTPPSPVVRVHTFNLPGTSSSGALPPQVSTTVTLKTALRKQWGRMYLPAPGTVAVSQAAGTYGRYTSAFVDLVETSTASLLNQCGGLGLIPMVWSVTGKGFMSVTGYEVDDIPDIQRRRRFATTGYRKQSAAG